MRLNLLVLRTAEPESLKDMYELLGFHFEYHKHGNGQHHFASEFEGFVLELYPLVNPEGSRCENVRLGFEIENLTSVLKRLHGSNWKILKELTNTEWGQIALIQDLDGRKIELKNKLDG